MAISLAELLVVKNEIEKEKEKSKKVTKPAKSQANVAPQPKDKRNMVVETSDSEKTLSLQLVRKARTHKTKQATIPGAILVLYSNSVTNSIVPVPVIPISIV